MTALTWYDHRLYLGKLYVASVTKWPTPANASHVSGLGRPWRGWINNDDEGEEHVGFFATADEAKAAVMARVTELIGATEGTI